MNTGRTIFSQIMDYLPLHEFRKCVKRYRGNYKVKSFSCLDQFFCMAFGAEPEYDKYGIANAITQAAQKEETWEKSIELEKNGFDLGFSESACDPYASGSGPVVCSV